MGEEDDDVHILDIHYWHVHDFVVVADVKVSKDMEHFILPFSVIDLDRHYHILLWPDLDSLIYYHFPGNFGIQQSYGAPTLLQM